MLKHTETAFVGIDWGTTHRRSYALDGMGACTNSQEDCDGALACKGRFPLALRAALKGLHANPARVVMSGMVGSALGWQDAPYLDAAVALADLPDHLVTVNDTLDGMAGLIVPGYCVRNQWGEPDVMRGEETQLLGACTLGHHSGWFVLPGTHSKWVELQAGRIVQLRTYMTGELFDLLIRQGTLAAAAGHADPVWDDAAFAQGVSASDHGALSHSLFGGRACVVCGDMPASSTQSYLSGVLIGSELGDVVRRSSASSTRSSFKLIGSPALAMRYQAAAALSGFAFELIDAQAAFVGAMAHIQTHGKTL
jgi:2-dehydro-3-deoxygalactonokinase